MRLAVGLPAVLFVFALADTAAAQHVHATTTVAATASVAPRPTLTVSSHVLQFRIEPGTTQAEAVIEFTAAMRARPDAEVLLTIEVAKAIQGPGGADVDAALTFTGEGAGVQSGSLDTTRSVVAARWSGGGQRRGRLVVMLRAAAPGDYTVPISYFLGTP
jgi:phage tail sheath gpL-like